MQLIFGKENAEKLKEKYTVLDLETLPTGDGRMLEVYCLIPADKLSIADLPSLENWVTLHNDFLNGYHTQQYDYCLQAVEHLMGKFGGEVDSFYEEILGRIKSQTEKSN